MKHHKIVHIVNGRADPNTPNGVNRWVHNVATVQQKQGYNVEVCVKEKFGNSYKDIPDEKFQEVVDYINFLKENPS